MKIIDFLPKYYKNSRVMQEIFTAFEDELGQLNIKVSSTQDQLFVMSADQNLNLHEKDAGVPSSGDISTRRGRVLSRLRGTGTATKAMIKNVIGSFVGGEILIAENAVNFLVDIKFVGYKGVPHNLESIEAAIEEIKPAHLVLTFSFTYCDNKHLQNYTHRELSNYTHDEITTLGGVQWQTQQQN